MKDILAEVLKDRYKELEGMPNNEETRKKLEEITKQTLHDFMEGKL
jgi:hypothetical protein